MPKTINSEQKKQEKQEVETSKLDVRIFPVKTDGAMKASATINLDGKFAITNVRIMEGTKGLFVSMPSYKGRNGEFKDICFPCTKEFKAEFDKAILSEYERTMSQTQTAKKQEPQSQSQELKDQHAMATM